VPTTIDYEIANGWHVIRGYSDGNSTVLFPITWTNLFAATDVIFIAALQGQNTRVLTINGVGYTGNISNGTAASDSMICEYFNGTGLTANPGVNGCNSSYLDVSPRVFNSAFSGNLNISVTTGEACKPTCAYGTGFNVQKLFVR